MECQTCGPSQSRSDLTCLISHSQYLLMHILPLASSARCRTRQVKMQMHRTSLSVCGCRYRGRVSKFVIPWTSGCSSSGVAAELSSVKQSEKSFYTPYARQWSSRIPQDLSPHRSLAQLEWTLAQLFVWTINIPIPNSAEFKLELPFLLERRLIQGTQGVRICQAISRPPQTQDWI